MLKLFLIILYLVCPFVLSAQSLMHVRYYSAKDGLSQNTVADFLQDDKGYIWMATWNGLEKFDGYTFQNYKSYLTDDTRLEYNRIQQIIKSQKGNIWCITYNNLLYLFDTRTEKFRNVFFGYPHLAGYEEVARIYKQTGGILWFSNKAGELFRIDEERLGEADGIVHLPCRSCAGHGQKIYTVYQDKRGYEWILTEQGTFVYNHPEIQTDVRLRYVKEADKSTYFLTEGGELYTFVPDAGILHIPNPFPMKPVSGLVSIKSGRLLIPDSEKVIVYDTRKKFFEQLYRQEAALDPLHVTGVHYSRKNVIWMLSGQRVLRYTPADRKVTSFQVNLTGTDTFRHVHEDEFGGIWFMTRSGSFYFYNSVTDGLEPAYRYTTGQKEPYRTEGRAFLRDSHKNLWVSRKYGFDKIYFTNRNYDYIHTSAEQEVRGVFIDSKKRLWVASKENRLEVYDKQGNYVGNMDSTGKLLQNRNISFGRNVYTFFEDSEHRLWLGTRNHGIVVATEYDGKFTLHTFRHDKQDPYALSNDAIYSICRDTRNRIWIGTLGGGINLFSGTLDNPRFIHSENLMKGYPGDMCHKVRSLCCTRKGVVLAGTTEGLLSFSDDFQKPEDIEFFHNDCEDGLSNNDVMDVLESRDGKIYIAAYSGGICMADVDSLLNTRIRFHYLNMKNGLPSDLPQSMLEDGEGNIWICFENYISKYRADRKGFDTYDSANLHTDLQITEAHPAIDQQGAMYIGTNQGVLRLRLYDLKKSSFVPRIVYAGVDIQNSDGTVSNSVLAADSLVLGKKERNVTIAFSALDYTNSEALQYAYRLKGISDQWGYIGENHSIGFANLPSGDFVLEVKSTNGDGVWCDNITPLYIHIQPRFTETAWAWVLYVLIAIILILTVSGIIVYITNLKRKVTLEQQLTDLKLRFFTDISHELRTPLTLISGSIEEIVERGQLQKSGTENMQVARRNVNRMLRLVNQILDFRKIQGRKMKLSIEQGDVVALCRQVGENFTQLAHERSIHFRLIPETPEIRCYTDMDKLEKILFNLLSNAFKYTADGKSITMAVRMESGCLFVSVRDEGKGMDLRKIDNLFGRFETFGKTDPNRSTGIGLSLVKEFVDLLHGTIQPESIPGQGTVFTVTLPCTYEAYAADSMAEFVLNDEVKFEYPVEVQLSRQEEKERSILIIEDNDELRRFLAMILRDCYHVLEAGDGRQGLEIIGRELPDLIVSDVMMPEMDGFELCHTLKTDIEHSHIPIILLTAKVTMQSKIEGIELGADDYIEKPFSTEYLLARIANLLSNQDKLRHAFTSSPFVNAKTIALSKADENFLDKLIEVIQKNISEPDFNVDILAEKMNMSRSSLHRKIKGIAQITPNEFIQLERLKMAAQLIQSGEYRINEVCYIVGFNSSSYFAKCFQKQFGVLPKDFCKNGS